MRSRWVVWLFAVILPTVAIYRSTTAFGFFSDDFQWLGGAEVFQPAHLIDISGRDHFYRPVLELYFPAALTVCGRSAVCFHWLSVLAHAITSLLVAVLATSLSRRVAIGTLAGALFAVQPGPVEAVTWISAISEVSTTLSFVGTLILFRRWLRTGAWPWWCAAFATFVVCLLTHESGVTLLPVLALSAWLLPPNDGPRRPDIGRLARALAPFALALVGYLAIAYVINTRNYLVRQGGYAIGVHIWTNIAGALVTLSVATRDVIGYLVVGAAYIWAIAVAPPRVRFFALWTLITLSPFLLFEHGLASRYLYLPAVGFAGMLAEMFWMLHGWLESRTRAGMALWWVVTVFAIGRFGVFAEKNVHNWAHENAPYREYAERVRQLYPSPAAGAVLDVPPPPRGLPPQYVESLLQWEFRDPTLKVR